MGNFCGPVLTHNPFTLKIQKMYLVCLFNGRVTKNKRCPKSKTLRQFSSDRFETNETCCQHIAVHVLLVLGRSDKNWQRIFDCGHRNLPGPNLETWASSVDRNSALNTLFPPLAYFFESSRHENSPGTT